MPPQTLFRSEPASIPQLRPYFGDRTSDSLPEDVIGHIEGQLEQAGQSPGQIREIIKEAYREGAKEALRENIGVKGRDPVEEAKKDLQREEEKHQQNFDKLTQKSNTVLMKIKSVFPFDLFPDEVSIDVNQVNIRSRSFFLSDRRHSVFIKNVMDIFVDSGPFFASLKISDSGYVENVISVKFLKKEEAKTARKIIQGLVIAHKEKVDLNKVNDRHLCEKVANIGQMYSLEN